MNPIALIREELKTSHDWFDGTMSGVTDDVAHWQPGGTAHSIGTRYAHMVVSEDTMINALLKGSPPLYSSSWAGKTGLEDPEAAFATTQEWGQSARVELQALREYARAVYANTDEYMAGLGESDLERTIDLSQWNMGTWSLPAYLLNFVFGHVRDIMGEVSALKGVHGLQGYPF